MEEEGIFLEIFGPDLIPTSIPTSQAFALLDIDEGSFVLAMLNFLRIHQISKPSAKMNIFLNEFSGFKKINNFLNECSGF